MTKSQDYKNDPPTEFKKIDTLSQKDAQKEINALREAIEYHDRKYYVENNPVISDASYDKLFKRLQDLEESFPDLRSENSPTNRVGVEPLDTLERIKHSAPMLSLNAVLAFNEFEEYHKSVLKKVDANTVKYVVEPKFDGVSVEIVYEEGQFKYGATRGDGVTGEDVSANLKTIGAIPLKLKENATVPDFLAVRGEVFISRKGFRQMNKNRIERDEEPYANPRNAASGILRRLESKVVARFPLDIFFYDVLEISEEEFITHWDELEQFPQWGLKTDPHYRRCSSAKEVASFHEQLENERPNLDYEIDGIVIKIDDKGLWKQLGSRQRSPRYALAWKFSPREEITTLEEIVIQVGRTGKLTPVALLQPVDVGGVTVSRATLHNAGELQEKDVREGDQVRIARAGDVIPEVIERVKQPGKKRSSKFQMPEQCPVCGTHIVQEGAYHYCPAGLSCEPQLIGRIQHYASRAALDINGLGEETSRDLVKKGFVKNLADLYQLSVDDLLQLEGFAEKSAKQLHDAIQDAKQPRLDRFLYGLGIRHVGERVARDLAEEFGTLASLRSADEDQLSRVKDIGPEIARSVRTFFADETNQVVLKRMEQRGVDVQKMTSSSVNRPLYGMKFVFTGELEKYTRAEAKDAVEQLGGRATGSVSGDTDYLVLGKDPGSKLDAAKSEENIQILNESEFEELLNHALA